MTANTTDANRAVACIRLVRLARECPREYPHRGTWGDIASVIALSSALAEEGFEHLAKAVKGGKGWSWQIQLCDGHHQGLVWLEEEASSAGWTWNKCLRRDDVNL